MSYVIRIGGPPFGAHDAQQVSLYALDSRKAQPPAHLMSSQDLNWCAAYPCSTVSACTTSGAASLHPVWGVFEKEALSAKNVSESVGRSMLNLGDARGTQRCSLRERLPWYEVDEAVVRGGPTLCK